MTCPHHWDFTPVSGLTSHGVCRLCGKEKDCNNYLTIDDSPVGMKIRHHKIREEKMSIEKLGKEKLARIVDEKVVMKRHKPDREELQIRESIVNQLGKMTERELQIAQEGIKPKLPFRGNPWKTHNYISANKENIIETYENESHSIAATAKVWYLPVNTVRGNLIAWGVHKPSVKAEVQQIAREVPGKSTGKSKTTMSYLWAGEEPRPCDQPCPMCGSCDISGKFTKRKQVLHTCQWCWYDWRTEPLK